MRKEKMKLKLREATFQPVTGNARRVTSSEAKEPVDFKVSVLASTVYSCLLTPVLVTRTRNRRINSRINSRVNSHMNSRINSRMNSRTSSRVNSYMNNRMNSRINSRINYHCLGLWHLLRGFQAFIIDTDNSI